MSLAISTVESRDGVALVLVVPRHDVDALVDIAACWVALQADTNVQAVGVVSATDDFSVGSSASTDVVIAPKSIGLLKPFGVGLRGDVYDYGLQLVADADVVLGTADLLIGDTSMARGAGATHATWLQGLVPDTEVSRLALLGVASPMTAARAAKLGLLDEIVAASDLEASLISRLRRLVGA